MVKITLSETTDRIFTTHGNSVVMDISTFNGIRKIARFIDINHGEFWTKPCSVFNGVRHPNICKEKQGNTSRKVTVDKFIQKLQEKHGNIVSLDVKTYVNLNTRAKFTDRDFGEWWTIPASLMNGSGHPQRGLNKRNKSQTIGIEELKKRLFNVHGESIRIKEDSYVKYSSKAIFIHIQYGEWSALPSNVIERKSGHPDAENEKKERTFLRKYGVKHSSQNKEIALKLAKTQNMKHLRTHWKTGEELVCHGGYESKVADYLNTNKIDFLWQPKTFTMPNDKTYRPDLFLINENKWIEIKGWMRKDAQEKWDWFLMQFPNSEIWDKKKLKEMGLKIL